MTALSLMENRDHPFGERKTFIFILQKCVERIKT
jgi:hypothetical protein